MIVEDNRMGWKKEEGPLRRVDFWLTGKNPLAGITYQADSSQNLKPLNEYRPKTLLPLRWKAFGLFINIVG